MSDAIRPLSETSHPRAYRGNRYVYPVLSRRSGGISVGINLNPDKACNFDCIYCQVDRRRLPEDVFVGLPQLVAELRSVLVGLQPGGALWREPEFARLPADKARVADIAFSGDGEPTLFRNFLQVVEHCVQLKEELAFQAAKMVLITNATGFSRPDVQRALAVCDAHNGEVWAKLDAGTTEYFVKIDKSRYPFQQILENLTACARVRALVIQSCFMRVGGEGPSAAEIDQWLQRLREIIAAGGRIKFVQVYTVARDPAFQVVSSLADVDVDAIAARVRNETGLASCAFHGEVPEGRGWR